MFKKGDKVRVIKSDHFSINEVGDEGIIVDVDSKLDGYKVEVSGLGNSGNWHYGYELELIKEVELEQRNEELIDFAQWYSGMDRDKVIRAYKRYQNETFKQKP
jgi:hypothetical protein